VIGVPLQFLVQFKGLELITVSHPSLIVGILPVLLALGSALFLSERLHCLESGVLTLSAIAAVLIALSGRSQMSGPQPSLRSIFVHKSGVLSTIDFDSYSSQSDSPQRLTGVLAISERRPGSAVAQVLTF
jgi:drug/metabolite transporter (DMT)-like permease